MTPSRIPTFAKDLATCLAARGAELVDIPIIQPADPFLDMAGEDLRRRIFLTENENGDSLCLRPEFTIPVCRNHIALNAATPKRYAYLGEVFRQRREGGTGFYQAGIEDLGEPEEAHADARSLADALACVRAVAADAELEIVLGDQAMFEAVLAALGLPRGWQKKLVRTFGNPEQLKSLLAGLASPRENGALPEPLAGLVAAQDEAALGELLESDMRAAGISPVAGRTPAEIARRLIERENLASVRLPKKALAALESFLAIRVTLDSAPGYLRDFAAKNKIDLSVALQAFTTRAEAIAAAGIDLGSVHYDAAFGRPLDYYTGLVYEIRAVSGGGVIVGGGRFDRLLTLLSASDPIPAVGFSIWLDRLEQLASDEQSEELKGDGKGRPQ